MALRLETTIVGTCHVLQEMVHHESHEGDAILELVANRDNLMLDHVKVITWIVVPLKGLDEADRFSKTIHTAFSAVNAANAWNSFLHYISPLGPIMPRDSNLDSDVKRNSLARAEVLQIGVKFAVAVNLASNRVWCGNAA
jgi:hypothetical protein